MLIPGNKSWFQVSIIMSAENKDPIHVNNYKFSTLNYVSIKFMLIPGKTSRYQVNLILIPGKSYFDSR